MTPRIAASSFIALAFLLTPADAASQGKLSASAALELSAASARSRLHDTSEAFGGVLFGGEASLTLGKLSLEVLYLEGGASSDRNEADRDVVEGEAMLGFRALRWLSLKIGPHARSFVTAQGTQRWMFWELRLGADAALGTPVLKGYFEGWTSLATNLDVAESLDRARGLQGGIRLEPQRSPVSFRIGYRMDHSRLADGLRLETMEHLMLAVGWRFGGR